MTDLAPTRLMREAELHQQLELLIAKIVERTASAADRDLYARLSQERIRMMQPSAVDRYANRQGRARLVGRHVAA